MEENLATLDRVYAMLEQLRNDAQAAVNAGASLRNDLLQVQIKQNEIESNQ